MSLIGYLAKAGKSMGRPINPELTIGISIPVVAIAVAVGVHRIRKMVEKAHDGGHG